MTVVRAGEPHEPADVVARPWHCAAEASPFARRRGFLGKEGQVVAEPAADGRSVLLNVGLGPAGSATPAVSRQAAATAIRAVGPARTVRLDLALTESTAMPTRRTGVRAMTEGARLALDRYDTFRSARPLPPRVEVRVTGGAPEPLSSHGGRGAAPQRGAGAACRRTTAGEQAGAGRSRTRRGYPEPRRRCIPPAPASPRTMRPRTSWTGLPGGPGSRCGGCRCSPTSAALYLSEFRPPGTRWAHLDIAAPAWTNEPPYGEVPH